MNFAMQLNTMNNAMKGLSAAKYFFIACLSTDRNWNTGITYVFNSNQL